MLDSGWLIANEGALRLSIFASVLSALVVAEHLQPALTRTRPRGRRWVTNLGLGVVGAILLRIALPGVAVLLAAWAQMRGWGLFNVLDMPAWVEVIAAILIFDVAVYFQHWATHRVPLLWRLHQVHHADHDIDVTTALRFHPLEILFSQMYKAALVIGVGASPWAVVAFEVVLNASAMFNHANLKVSGWAERLVRLVLVTPDMHRIHHSVRPRETNANFGFCLSAWDRVFGTYCAQAQTPLTIGLSAYRDENPSDLAWSLTLPFRNPRV